MTDPTALAGATGMVQATTAGAAPAPDHPVSGAVVITTGLVANPNSASGFSAAQAQQAAPPPPPCVVSGKFADALHKLWPKGDITIPGTVAGIIATAPAVFPKYHIISDLVVAHIMAEFSEETGCGLDMRENMNYSAARLLEVFPTHFTHDQAIAMQHNPRSIADQAYGSRMGNHPGTDDGWNFRGQGLSQLTGRTNYATLAKTTGLDLLNHPDFLVDPAHALDCGVGDFVQCGCLPYAQKDMLVGVASMLNVGHYVSDPHKINGYSMRANWLSLWKHALGVN